MVVTMAGLARAFGEIALLDEEMQRQHAGLFACQLGLSDVEYGLMLTGCKQQVKMMVEELS